MASVAVLSRALLPMLLFCCFPLPQAQAFPAFSRQTGCACTLCHFQNMHSLNAYGREFLENSFHETPEMLRQRRRMQQRTGHAEKPGKAALDSAVREGSHLDRAPAGKRKASP